MISEGGSGLGQISAGRLCVTVMRNARLSCFLDLIILIVSSIFFEKNHFTSKFAGRGDSINFTGGW